MLQPVTCMTPFPLTYTPPSVAHARTHAHQRIYLFYDWHIATMEVRDWNIKRIENKTRKNRNNQKNRCTEAGSPEQRSYWLCENNLRRIIHLWWWMYDFAQFRSQCVLRLQHLSFNKRVILFISKVKNSEKWLWKRTKEFVSKVYSLRKDKIMYLSLDNCLRSTIKRWQSPFNISIFQKFVCFQMESIWTEQPTWAFYTLFLEIASMPTMNKYTISFL